MRFNTIDVFYVRILRGRLNALKMGLIERGDFRLAQAGLCLAKNNYGIFFYLNTIQL